MNPQLKKNLSSSHGWTRALYVILFLWLAGFACMLAAFIAFAQIVISLITGQPNSRLVQFGASLSQFLYGIGLFATHNTESKPFPFSDWPQACDKDECSQSDIVAEPVNESTKESPACGHAQAEACSSDSANIDTVDTPESAGSSADSSAKNSSAPSGSSLDTASTSDSAESDKEKDKAKTDSNAKPVIDQAQPDDHDKKKEESKPNQDDKTDSE